MLGQPLFGPGALYIQRNDIANQTPISLLVQEFSYDDKGTIKELNGTYQYAIMALVGTRKLTGKWKLATMSGRAWNDTTQGSSFTLGTQYDVYNGAPTAIPATPFQITPTMPSSGTFVQDLGVINSSTGLPMELVTGTPTTGQYTQAAGVYTFSTADHTSGISVVINALYSYTTGATGQSLTWINKPIGSTPSISIVYKSAAAGQTFLVKFNQAVVGSHSLGFKLEDFAMPEQDFTAYSDQQVPPQIGTISLATQA